MKRVTGIGGIFFQADDPKALGDWYEKHLGIPRMAGSNTAIFTDSSGMTVWTLFEKRCPYFQPSNAPFMLNYRVDNLDALLEALHAEGVDVDPKREDSDYGRFAWIRDPEGNKIELWEPPKDAVE